MATTRKSYTNTRTGATRLSTAPLGFPFVPTPKEATPDADAAKDADKGADKSASDKGGK